MREVILYRFNNVSFVSVSAPVYRKVNDEYVELDFTKIKGTSPYSISMRMVNDRVSDDDVFYVKNADVVDYKYVANEDFGVKSPISSDVFNKLSSSIKKLYTSEKIIKESYNELSIDKTIVFDADYDPEYKVDESKFPVKITFESSVFPHYSNLQVSGDELRKYLYHLSTRNNNPRVLVREYFRSLEVLFFEKDYNGEVKKNYLRKQNGQMYADLRFKTVPDYPTTVSKLTLEIDDNFMISADSFEELEEIGLKLLKKIRYEKD